MDKNFKALDVSTDNLVAFGHPDDLKWLGPWSLESRGFPVTEAGHQSLKGQAPGTRLPKFKTSPPCNHSDPGQVKEPLKPQFLISQLKIE